MEMVSTRRSPWARLGHLGTDDMSVQEALVAGGLDFTVSARDLAFSPEGAHDGATWTEAPHRKMIVRDDTGQPFDVVSSDYPVVQYRDAFAMADGYGGRAVAAGTLKEGRQGFMVLTLPGLEHLALLGGDDPHDLFLTVRTSHDRTRKIEFALMPLRNKCTNQLPLATFTRGAKQRWSVGHTGDVQARLAVVEAGLRNTAAYAAELAEMAARLAAVQVDHDQAVQVLHRVLDDKPTRDRKVEEVLAHWADDAVNGHAGDGWGLVNAVSEYYDWGRGGGTAESRFTAALDGFGQTYKAVNTAAGFVLTRLAGR